MGLRAAPAALAALALAAAGCGGSARPPTAEVFVLAGQSNMVGAGTPPGPSQKVPGASQVLPDGRLVPLRDRLRGTTGPLPKPLSGFKPGIGPAPSFVRTLQAGGHTAHIIVAPCAVAGTAMAQWQPGGALYDRCVRMTRRALASSHGTLSGILFWQGEADAATAAQAALWPGRFLSFAAGFRRDLRRPEAPLVFAVLGTNGEPQTLPGWEVVRQAQATIPLPPRAARIRVDGLPMEGGIHYTAAAQAVIGQRFAQAWENLAET
ncbi:MAG: sialate O-acetylesterase [Actinomycetota bacterium]|nr:sialate O-acetylesterase [Actinomycetota bacterium]